MLDRLTLVALGLERIQLDALSLGGIYRLAHGRVGTNVGSTTRNYWVAGGNFILANRGLLVGGTQGEQRYTYVVTGSKYTCFRAGGKYLWANGSVLGAAAKYGRRVKVYCTT